MKTGLVIKYQKTDNHKTFKQGSILYLYKDIQYPLFKKKKRLQDHYLPFLDHGAHLVTGQVHAVEVGEAVLALNILGDELEFAEGHLVVLQVSEAHLEHTSLQAIGGDS